jgi:aquaporin Z
MVMIVAGGHISGGHFNPAVTLGVWLRGKCEAKDVAPYMTFQIMGGVLAALVVSFGGIAPLYPATVPALLAEGPATFPAESSSVIPASASSPSPAPPSSS